MTATMTEAQIADKAVSIVLAALPYSREVMAQMKSTDLPIMMTDGTICGPAPDNAAIYVEYPKDWCGLAASSNGGDLLHWFIYRCERFNERALGCLGTQSSVSAAINAAVLHVTTDLTFWGRQHERS